MSLVIQKYTVSVPNAKNMVFEKKRFEDQTSKIYYKNVLEKKKSEDQTSKINYKKVLKNVGGIFG